jgi:hypothetical protein
MRRRFIIDPRPGLRAEYEAELRGLKARFGNFFLSLRTALQKRIRSRHVWTYKRPLGVPDEPDLVGLAVVWAPGRSGQVG